MNIQVFLIYYTVLTRNVLPVFHRSIMAPISTWTAWLRAQALFCNILLLWTSLYQNNKPRRYIPLVYQSNMSEPVLFQYVIYRVIFVPICDLPRHFRSNMWSTASFSFQYVIYRAIFVPICDLPLATPIPQVTYLLQPLADKYTNLGMCRLVVLVAQFTCLRFDARNRQQCRATWNSLKQLYVARKWLYNIYANMICWMIRRKLC